MASYSDNFDRADGDIGANWIVDNGDFNIVSNVAASQTVDVFNRARYASAMDSSNHTVVATVNALGGVTARQASSTNTLYEARVDAYDNSRGYRIRKWVAGVETVLAEFGNDVTSGSIRITLTVNGSSLIMKARIYSGGWLDDQEIINITDTSITTGTYAGISAHSNISTINDWSAQDLAATAIALPRRALDGPFYGSLRGSVR